MKELSNLKETTSSVLKEVPFTAEDMRNLYQISEAMINAEDEVAKYDAIADVFSDAMAYNAANHTEPSQNDIMLNIALVMFNYSRRAIKAISEANKKLGILYKTKRQLSEGGFDNE